MTIYATMNPVGSTSPKDLKDNSQNLDYLILGPALSYPDRRGVSRLSWAGIEASFAAAQSQRAAQFDADQGQRAASYTAAHNQRANDFNSAQAQRSSEYALSEANRGYENPVAFAAGLAITRVTQIIQYGSELYKAKPGTLPFTTTGVWETDKAKFTSVGDNALRQDMADPVQGRAILSWLVDANSSNYTRIAHRGYAGLAPENTMTAFTNAYNVGADVLESDVQVTADGYCVIIHDDTVDRTTNGTGNVKDLTLAQIQALDAGSKFSAKFSSTRIPTFDELIKFAKPRFKTLYTEVKGYRTQADIDIMLSVILANRAEDLVNLSSFLFEDLSYIRARNQKIALGYLSFNSLDRLPLVVALGGDLTMIFDYSYILGFPSAVETCRNAGVDVAVYTVNSQPTVEALIALGVTKIISNFMIGDGR